MGIEIFQNELYLQGEFLTNTHWYYQKKYTKARPTLSLLTTQARSIETIVNRHNITWVDYHSRYTYTHIIFHL
jgi:hypothetical protein